MRTKFVILIIMLFLGYNGSVSVAVDYPSQEYYIKIESSVNSSWCKDKNENYFQKTFTYEVSVQDNSIDSWTIRVRIVPNLDFLNMSANETVFVNKSTMTESLVNMIRTPISSIFTWQSINQTLQSILKSMVIINSFSWVQDFIDSLQTHPRYLNIFTPVEKLNLEEWEETSVSSGSNKDIQSPLNDSFEKFQFGLFVRSKEFTSEYEKDGVLHKPALVIDNSIKMVYKFGFLNNLEIDLKVDGTVDSIGFELSQKIKLSVLEGVDPYNLSDDDEELYKLASRLDCCRCTCHRGFISPYQEKGNNIFQMIIDHCGCSVPHWSSIQISRENNQIDNHSIRFEW